MATRLLVDGAEGNAPRVALAHGAGAPMDIPFMNAFASGLAGVGLRVVRFEFPYMAARRTGGRRRPPDPARVLLETWRAVIAELGGGARLVIGGKSLGGRMASMVADEAGARGLVCLGYPFHPPGRPERTRTAHLEKLETPALILQGERDPMGSREEVERYALSPAIRVRFLPDGNHDLAPRKRSGHTRESNWTDAVHAIVEFVRSL
jgi:predicted alpha/beta-hydrolase family hydrolase